MWNSLSNINYYEGVLTKRLANRGSLDQTDVDFRKICRTCLRDAPDCDNLLKDFEIGAMNFNFDGKVLKLIDMLSDFSGQEVSDSDPFPHQICNNCIQNISGAYFFRLQCHKAENILRRLHNALNESVQLKECSSQSRERSTPTSIKNEMTGDGTSTSNTIEMFHQNDENVEEIENDGNYSDKKISIEFDGVQYQIDSEMYHDDDEDEEVWENEETDLLESRATSRNSEDLETGDAKLQKIKIEIFKNDEEAGLENVIEVPRRRRKYTRMKNESDSADKGYVCDICNSRFTKVQSLKRHMKIHQADQKNKFCSFCGKGFIRTDDLTRHIRIHTGERPYACSLCPKRYKQTSELKEHQLSHSDKKTFSCSICGKVLKTRNGHYVHMRIHLGLKKHICEYCGNRYVTSGELNSHMRHIHEKRKPFRCSKDGCDRAFTTKHALKIHERAHTGERPFHCTHCIKKFSSKAFLADHLRTHVGTSPYKCSICNKIVVTQQALRKHMQVHIATSQGINTSLECSTCARNFATVDDLETHTNEHCTGYEQLDDGVHVVEEIDEDETMEDEIDAKIISISDE